MKNKLIALCAVLLFAAACTSAGPFPPPTAVPTMPDIQAPSVPTANTAAEITYELKEGGTFVFINGPEPIRLHDLADITNVSLYTGTFDGSMHLWFGHNNETGRSIYYGLHFHNPGADDAVLTLLNHGASLGWTENCETLRLYYEFSGTGTEYTIAAGESMWLFFAQDTRLPVPEHGARTFVTEFDPVTCLIPINTFDGMLRVSGSAALDVRVMSWFTAELDRIDPLGTEYPNSNHVVGATGWSPYLGEIQSVISWTVDDGTPAGRLPVDIRGNTFDHWVTNAVSRHGNVIRSDSLPLFIKYRDDYQMLAYNIPDIRTGIDWPWANWGVIYQHHFFITNNSSEPKTFAYYIGRGQHNQYIGAYSPLNSPAYRSLPFSDINNWLGYDQMVVEITVLPGETKLMPAEFVLGGQSGHLVTHYVTMRGPVTLEPSDSAVYSAVAGYAGLETTHITVRNTSGGEITDLTVTGSNTEAFALGDDKLTDLGPGQKTTIWVSPVDGLPAGLYEADIEIRGGGEVLAVFRAVLTVSTPGVYDYLLLIPPREWSSSQGDSEVVVAHGLENGDGIPSLVFSNTAGLWPNATGEIVWGTGIRFDRSEFDEIYME
jgi:hypothetical protein